MKQQEIHPQGAPPPGGPYAHGIKVGDTVWTAGQAPFDAAGSIIGDDAATQTEAVFDNLERVLTAAGATLNDVVKVVAHLQHMSDFNAYNVVYARRFGSHRPVRTTVGSTLGGFLVEIDAIAVIGSGN